MSLAVYELGGTDFIGFLETSSLDGESVKQSCKAIADRYDRKVEVKRRFTFNATHKRRVDAAGKCQTMLNITTLTLLSANILANVESGNFDIQTEAKSSDAGGDLLETMVATGTTFNGSLTLKVPSATAATLIATMANPAATLDGTFVFTDAVGTINVPITLTKVTKAVNLGEVQMITVAFEGNGVPTSTGGSGTLIATILAGTALVDLEWSDAETVTGSALMLSGSVAFQNGDITKETYSMHLNTITVGTAS